MKHKHMKQLCFLANKENEKIVASIAEGKTWLEAFEIHNESKRKERRRSK